MNKERPGHRSFFWHETTVFRRMERSLTVAVQARPRSTSEVVMILMSKLIEKNTFKINSIVAKTVYFETEHTRSMSPSFSTLSIQK